MYEIYDTIAHFIVGIGVLVLYLGYRKNSKAIQTNHKEVSDKISQLIYVDNRLLSRLQHINEGVETEFTDRECTYPTGILYHKNSEDAFILVDVWDNPLCTCDKKRPFVRIYLNNNNCIKSIDCLCYNCKAIWTSVSLEKRIEAKVKSETDRSIKED